MMNELVRHLVATMSTRGGDRRDERGDVPGWVLITVMTAGLVTALWAVAGDALSQMLTDALRSVSS
jgi:hypothetical protein